jgi:hypothetical protein
MFFFFCISHPAFSLVTFQHDPRLRLVVRDATPTSCRVYEFGHGSSIATRHDLHSADTPTAVVLEKRGDSEVERCNLEFFAPADAQADTLILELPIGAALFHDLTIETHADDVTLSAAYVEYLKGMKWSWIWVPSARDHQDGPTIRVKSIGVAASRP